MYRDAFGHYHHTMVRDNGGEVRLSSGAMGSPQLLLLSGIGWRPYLDEWGISVALHLPYVGQFLYDNPSNPSSSKAWRALAYSGGGYNWIRVVPFSSPAHSHFIRQPSSPLYLTVATIMEKIYDF